ncbi:MAG TPA: SURF1 family protein [Mycobacteriales bacterium]|nr:SURF1 family protein [Mycobacteriales bacterium]
MLVLLRQARYLALVAVCVVLAAGCVAAGLWQVHRYHGKHDANTLLRRNDARPVVPVERLLAPGQTLDPDQQFRRVSARGHYDVTGQVFVRQREVDNQAGYLVLTPLRTDAGPVLLIVRGWMRVGGSATQTPTVPPPPAGEVSLTGRVFPSEASTGQRGLPTGQIERINVPGLARRLGAVTYGGYVELISERPAEHGVRAMPAPDLSNPAGGAFEGQHLAYVVQWFIFAALALAAPPVLAYKDAHRDDGDGPPGSDHPEDPDGSTDPGDPTDPDGPVGADGAAVGSDRDPARAASGPDRVTA